MHQRVTVLGLCVFCLFVCPDYFSETVSLYVAVKVQTALARDATEH